MNSIKREKFDEIINTLFNPIEIKDESLDINISACATILPSINNSINFPWSLDEVEFQPTHTTQATCDNSSNANDVELKIDKTTSIKFCQSKEELILNEKESFARQSVVSSMHDSTKMQTSFSKAPNFQAKNAPQFKEQIRHHINKKLCEKKLEIKKSCNIERKEAKIRKQAASPQKRQKYVKKNNLNVIFNMITAEPNCNDNASDNLISQSSTLIPKVEQLFPLTSALSGDSTEPLSHISSEKKPKTYVQNSPKAAVQQAVGGLIPQQAVGGLIPKTNTSLPQSLFENSQLLASNQTLFCEVIRPLSLGYNQLPLQSNVGIKAEVMENKIEKETVPLLQPPETTIILKFKYKCDFCGLYDTLNDLMAVKTHQIEHNVTFLCCYTDCDKNFPNELSLKKHYKSHFNSIRRSALIECPDCGKLLKLGSMWMHRKIHNGKKPNGINSTKNNNTTVVKSFECPDCGKLFPERSQMIRHQKYHSERKFQCEKCFKMYKTERCLKVHSLVHLDQRPFSCTLCQKSFLSNSKLKQHLNIHTGQRPFKCNYCSRDFTNFPNWLKHTRRRHGVDHKTGEILKKMPKYCSKSKKEKDKVEHGSIKVTETKQIKKEIISSPVNYDEKLRIKQELIGSGDEICIKMETNDVEMNAEQNFTDLHCLSITSTEDLLLEHALELEEQAAAVFFNQNALNYLDPDERNYKELRSIESSPLSSPASDFNNFFMPSISNNNRSICQNNSINNLPSMSTFSINSLANQHR